METHPHEGKKGNGVLALGPFGPPGHSLCGLLFFPLAVGQGRAAADVELSFAKSWTISPQYQGEFGRTDLDSSQLGGGVKLGF